MKTAVAATRLLLAWVLGATLAPDAAAQASEGPALSGFTCCNFHYEDDWISDANWSAMPMIPAGTPIRTLGYGNNRVAVDIGGRRMRLGLDYGRRQSFTDWVQLMIVQEDPKPKIASWPAPLRDAVVAGKVEIGMTKEQVIVAVGYPPAHQTPTMDALQWKYWHTGFGTYLVLWDDSGKVKDVIADPATRSRVLASSASSVVSQQGAGRDPSPWALPAAGASWTYELSDQIFRRGKTGLIVEVRRVNSPILEEHVSMSTGATRTSTIRRDIDVSAASVLESRFGGGTVLLDFAPYLLAARGERGWNDVIEVTGYPTGGGGTSRWAIKTQPLIWEQITVPAGTFRTARLDVDGRRVPQVLARGEIARFSISVWYAPEVRRFVRLEHKAWSAEPFTPRVGKQMGHDLIELLAYRPPS